MYKHPKLYLAGFACTLCMDEPFVISLSRQFVRWLRPLSMVSIIIPFAPFHSAMVTIKLHTHPAQHRQLPFQSLLVTAALKESSAPTCSKSKTGH